MFAQIKEDIACVFDRDPAARNWFEVITTYPGLHALQAHRLAHWVWNHNLKWLARVLSSFSRLLTGIEIIDVPLPTGNLEVDYSVWVKTALKRIILFCGCT